MASNRSEKIADLIKREVSLILNKDVKDPRFQNLNLTAVKVTDDIGIAYLYCLSLLHICIEYLCCISVLHICTAYL